MMDDGKLAQRLIPVLCQGRGTPPGPRTRSTSRFPTLTTTVALLFFTAMPQPSHADESLAALTKEQASAFARLALKGLGKEYPNKPEHVMGGPDDVKSPRALHPAFYGSYDWHSSVHGHWM